MARIVRLETWRHRVFDPQDLPAYKTVLKWAKSGQIPGAVLLGGAWRVDMDQFEASLHELGPPAPQEEEAEEPTVGGALADRLAAAGKKAG